MYTSYTYTCNGERHHFTANVPPILKPKFAPRSLRCWCHVRARAPRGSSLAAMMFLCVRFGGFRQRGGRSVHNHTNGVTTRRTDHHTSNRIQQPSMPDSRKHAAKHRQRRTRTAPQTHAQ